MRVRACVLRASVRVRRACGRLTHAPSIQACHWYEEMWHDDDDDGGGGGRGGNGSGTCGGGLYIRETEKEIKRRREKESRL